MAFPGRNYAPPGVYTQTSFDNPLAGGFEGLKIPVIIGEGNEYLVQENLELVRGSSSFIDQRVVKEDMTGRSVVDVSVTGVVTLGAFDGVLRKVQVRNFPIVTGDGSGTTTIDRSDVAATINGSPVIVQSVAGSTGLVELVVAPEVGDDVRVTYFFNRTDTLVTDNVSEQVTDTNAILLGALGYGDVDAPAAAVPPVVLSFHGDILNTTGQVVVAANNVLILTIDGTAYTLTLPARNDYTIAQVANTINALAAGTLVASRFTNNYGLSALQLVADQDLVIGAGSANALLGLVAGDVASRNRVFYTFNGPIVDGSNGGVTTTDPAHVTVKVDGVQVIPTSVDGASRAVTLAVAPVAGATVTIQYFFNTWQDTFDFLAHLNIVDITQCGTVPNSSEFINGSDFILKGDRIHWGTSFQVENGVHSTGSEFFNEQQVGVLLIDNRTYLSPCTEVVDTSTGVSVASKTQFQLAFEPTLGNGRDTELGTSLFQTVSNNRIDLPVNRPDVIKAYYGFDVQDALSRGAVTVSRVEGTVITLASAVPTGATVFATFYYNLLTDQEYTLTSGIAGVSGVGTYTITDQGGDTVFNPKFNIGSKGAGLTGVTVNWPSGSEFSSDLRFESVSGSAFVGPKAEIVTVQFAAREATPAKYSVPGAAPYDIVENESDRANIYVDGAVLSNNGAGDAGLDLANPSGHSAGFFASFVGDEISYTGDGVGVVGASYELETTELINIEFDGVLTQSVIEDSGGVAVTVAYQVAAINENVGGHQALAQAGSGVTTIVLAATASGIDEFYTGWVVVLGDTGASPGEYRTVLSYVGSTQTATISTGATDWAFAPVVTDPYYIYNPANLAQLKGATRFEGPFESAVGEYDKLSFGYVGDVTGASTILTADLGNGPFATAALLAAEVEAQMAVVIAVEVGLTPALAGFAVFVEADADGRLAFSFQLPGLDSAGFLAFTNGAAGADFAVVAGLDTAASASGAQAKLLQGPVARRYTIAPSGSALTYDRLVLRNRIIPGGNSTLSPESFVEQQSLVIGNGSGNTKTGLVATRYGLGHSTATVRPASLVGFVSWTNGQGSGFGDDRDHQPGCIFYDGTGANTANDTLIFTLDGVSTTVTFTATAGGTFTALGPATVAGSILAQVIAAMAALPGAPFGSVANIRDTLRLVRQEGSGMRITSSLSSTSSYVTIGAGTANTVLGLAEGDTAVRTQVGARVLASAFNSNANSSIATWMVDPSTFTVNYFATDALAWVQTDGAGREYLYLQSNTAGPSSAIQWRQATVASVQTDDILFAGTGILVPNLAGETGEAALDGFFVTSSNPAGTGSAATSVLNNGTGADGIVGQTYRDAVTGLTFTILPRGFQANPAGPWLSYPTGGTATFRIDVSSTFVTDANIPTNALNGIELTVANTLNVASGDTALVSTFERGGNEPAIGDLYNVSYVFTKDSFGAALFTKMSAIEAAYGVQSPDNPVSLAASLAFLNGAVLIGIKQVQRAEGLSQASITSYRDAIDQVEGFLPGQVSADLVTPLRGDSIELYQYLKRSNVKMSSIRYRQERTSILGVSGGTSPAAVQAIAQLLGEARMRVVYPDVATIAITDAFNSTKEHLIDGPMLAAMLTGSVVSPNLDVATPWTGRNLVGPSRLGRVLDAVEANQTAVRGVTVLVDKPPFIRVRHGLTTDMSNILTKTPTIVLIADEVQRQSRLALDRYIGIKFIPGILSQIEGRLAMVLKSMVANQIIANYTNVSASPALDDPTTVEVAAYYQPVFPLLYLVLSFHMRSSL